MDEIGILATQIDELCRFLLDAPEEVHAKLHESHKLRIIQVFTGLQHGAVAPPAPEKVEGSPSTGESASPA
jgi:hypothetical protein